MTQRKSTTMWIGLASCVAILSFVAYSARNDEKNQPGTEKSSKDESVPKKRSSPERQNLAQNGDRASQVACKPMFKFANQELAKKIINMADQRARRWMSFQISGAHRMVGQVGGKSHNPILILDTMVMKPVRHDHRGVREIAFYEAIQASSKRTGFETYCSLFSEEAKDCDITVVDIETKLLYRLEPHTARYFGIIEYHNNTGTNCNEQKSLVDEATQPYGIKPNSYVLLNNVTKNFSRPCVLDIKMGTQTYEPDAPKEKKSYELGKYSSQKYFGFRLTAMRIYDPLNADADEDGYIYYPKQFGRSLSTRESVKASLLNFLGGPDLPREVRANRTSAIQSILSRLKMIRGWFRDNKSFAFYGSSILVVYEGDTVLDDIRGIEFDMAKAKMIDFGRVRRQPGGDLGYLKGLKTLIVIFEEILRESFLDESTYIRPSGK
mmetsp:Transcript_907/g.2297  ORF Transcript_907/g.2297 Transcript_907/m.2297 type:complete len:437 (+) Transcript_907:584-1894(+)